MAKKKAELPWALDDKVAKKEAKNSLKETIKDKKGERKILKVYEEAHRRAKFMAFESGMKLTDYLEYLINGAWEQRNPK